MAKTWFATVQNSYASLEELMAYDSNWYIASRAGFSTIEELWDKNPIIGGSVNPADFGIVTAEEMAEILVDEYKEAIEFTESETVNQVFDYSEDAESKICDDLTKFINLVGMDTIKELLTYAGNDTFKNMFAYDLWLTRNGHGSGFWDSVCWGEFQNLLTEKSEEMGNCDAYLGDDGLVYFSG